MRLRTIRWGREIVRHGQQAAALQMQQQDALGIHHYVVRLSVVLLCVDIGFVAHHRRPGHGEGKAIAFGAAVGIKHRDGIVLRVSHPELKLFPELRGAAVRGKGQAVRRTEGGDQRRQNAHDQHPAGPQPKIAQPRLVNGGEGRAHLVGVPHGGEGSLLRVPGRHTAADQRLRPILHVGQQLFLRRGPVWLKTDVPGRPVSPGLPVDIHGPPHAGARASPNTTPLTFPVKKRHSSCFCSSSSSPRRVMW
mgnify:CR=1 FL=1